MKIAQLGDIDVHYREDGAIDGPAVVFANSLGTDLRLWDPILPYMPNGLRLIRYDMRGHGLTTCPPAPFTMGTLVADAERLIDHLELKNVVFVGLSIGGMVAQGLAVKRMDQVPEQLLITPKSQKRSRETCSHAFRGQWQDGLLWSWRKSSS